MSADRHSLFGPSPLARPDAPPGFEPVARERDLMPGVPLQVRLADGELVCLVRADGAVHALRDRCTHQAFPLSQGDVYPDGTLECAWHGARFDLTTGEARCGPASGRVPVYRVQVVDGWICVAPPDA